LRPRRTNHRWRYPRTKQARYVAKLSRWQKQILEALWRWEAELDTWLEAHPGDSQWQTVKVMRAEGDGLVPSPHPGCDPLGDHAVGTTGTHRRLTLLASPGTAWARGAYPV
jgi:hypothetical protein